MYKLLENEKQSIVTENMLVVTLGPEGSSAGKRDYNGWKENLRIDMFIISIIVIISYVCVHMNMNIYTCQNVSITVF